MNLSERNRITEHEAEVITDYLQYHNSTDIRPVRRIWYKCPDGVELPYYVFRFKDNGEQLSGIYAINKDRYMHEYATEVDVSDTAHEKDLIDDFLNDRMY